eukprot:TRINITY_DN105_c0_g1_i1.p1 TRINITY_DN105_c0_g1~~TRINITY_DN105_c0_g1_i1.p1  ORF type:complete len:527 (+),score=156.90 TRINITY_DN105_c0_g1_i1:160-1740(+)
MKTILSLLLLASSLALSHATCDVYCAYSAVLNKTIGPSGSVDRASYFFDEGLFAPSVYNAQDGQCSLQASFSGDSLVITGTVYAPNDPSTGFFINIQTTKATSGEWFLELDPSVYVQNGGYIDQSTWTHYSLVSGSLVGFGQYQVNLQLTESMHPLQVGVGANGKNANFGLSAWFDFSYNGSTRMSDINVDLTCQTPSTPAPTTVPTAAPTPAPTAVVTPAPTAEPTPAPTPVVTPAPTAVVTPAPTAVVTPAPTTSDGSTSGATSGATSGSTSGSESNSGSSGEYTCPPNAFVVRQAIADQYGANSYFAFIFNTSNDVQYRFDFVNDNGRFQVNSDNTATLTGTLAPLGTNPQDGVFDFDFTASINFQPGSVPAEPHQELHSDAYVPNGPVDTATWTYYQLTSATFTLTNGYGLSIIPYMDMEFQVGDGANGKNVNYGASAWFQFFFTDGNSNLIASGIMDINVDLVCEAAGASSTTGATSTTDSSVSGGAVESPTSPATTATSSASAASVSLLLALIVAIVLSL